MEPFNRHTGLVAPLDRANVDTDAIIPKQFLKSVQRTGFGPYLFDEWRYLDHGEPGMECSQRPQNPDFVLNQPRYAAATVLLARANFGCGSSREHAPWALRDYGFRAIVAPSFADIFYSNCFKNGLLPVVLDEGVVDQLFQAVYDASDYRLTIDLPEQVVTTPHGDAFPFTVDPFRKRMLLEGLDEIGVTLAEQAEAIRAYEQRRAQEAPWLFAAR
ncbi:3-isopropylmalate dehydratase small subunit [Halorhodospira abdelmalekii]|uniref:3-isopropylmalate dehydratase small subunit n=1 Tax=Halorhodospira abdelmalekii TaxID=421629 RepID=UPI001903954C|nr:3-isopropylmalate dehydratase small subunit [Halorhodospira abdelmalekii]